METGITLYHNYSGYVYETTNNINGKKYIGSRKLNKPTVKRAMADKYIGSGVALEHAIKKHGRKNFSKRILLIGDNILFLEDIILKEIKPSLQVDDSGNKLYYNLKDTAIAGIGGHNKGKKATQQQRDNMSKSWDVIRSELPVTVCKYCDQSFIGTKYKYHSCVKSSCLNCKKSCNSYRLDTHICNKPIKKPAKKRQKPLKEKAECQYCNKMVYVSVMRGHINKHHTKPEKPKKDSKEYRDGVSRTLKEKHKSGELKTPKETLQIMTQNSQVRQSCLICKKEFNRGNFVKHLKVCN